MALHLSPVRGLPGQAETAISIAGDVLTVDGTAYDLSAVPEGGEAVASEGPFCGPIARTGGVLTASVVVMLGDDAAPVQPSDPAHWIVPWADGPVTIPAVRKPPRQAPPEAVE
jgi:hypothetical protein